MGTGTGGGEAGGPPAPDAGVSGAASREGGASAMARTHGKRLVRCEMCGALAPLGRERCPYCEAPLPQPGFFRKYMWEIGGGLAGAVAGALVAPAIPYAALCLTRPFWSLARPTWIEQAIVWLPVCAVGACWLLGTLWGYRMRRGRARLYQDWDEGDNLTLGRW